MSDLNKIIPIPDKTREKLTTLWNDVVMKRHELEKANLGAHISSQTFLEFVALTKKVMNVPRPEEGMGWDIEQDLSAFKLVELGAPGNGLPPEVINMEPATPAEGQIDDNGDPIPQPVDQRDACEDPSDTTGA